MTSHWTVFIVTMNLEFFFGDAQLRSRRTDLNAYLRVRARPAEDSRGQKHGVKKEIRNDAKDGDDDEDDDPTDDDVRIGQDVLTYVRICLVLLVPLSTTVAYLILVFRSSHQSHPEAF